MISEKKHTSKTANAVIDNMINALHIAVESAPYAGVGTENIESSLRYFSGSEFPLFNGVFSDINVANDPDKHFSEITQFFSSKNTPFTWWWMQPYPIPEIIQNKLNSFGFQPLGVYSGIATNLNGINSSPLPENVIIKEVVTDSKYQDFINILSEVFHFTESIKTDYAAMFKSYGPTGSFKHYLGYYANEPAATLTSYIDGEVVGLYSGATLPTAQKNGLCTALIIHAIQEAKKLHCQIAIAQLMAPAMAQGLTEKLGFKTCCELLPFIKEPN